MSNGREFSLGRVRAADVESTGRRRTHRTLPFGRTTSQPAIGVHPEGTAGSSERLRIAIAEELPEETIEFRMTAVLALDDPQLRLRAPLPVEIAEGHETVTASSPDFEVYGSGGSEYEALTDLRRVIVDEYRFLLDNEARLGLGPLRQLQRMRQLLEQVP